METTAATLSELIQFIETNMPEVNAATSGCFIDFMEPYHRIFTLSTSGLERVYVSVDHSKQAVIEVADGSHRPLFNASTKLDAMELIETAVFLLSIAKILKAETEEKNEDQD